MLVGTQLKLSDRRSCQRYNKCNPSPNSMVIRPCTLRNITEEPPKATIVPPTPEKRSAELRVVSLNLENQPTKEIKRSPHRMPLFCVHFKRIQKIYHKDETNLDDDFLVRGFEVGSCVTDNVNHSDETDTLETDERDELKCLQNGIQIRLTDCCQCACDLFNSNFQALHDDRDFNFIPIGNYSSSRVSKPREVVVPQNNPVIDPNILKVIRVTMNAKK